MTFASSRRAINPDRPAGGMEIGDGGGPTAADLRRLDHPTEGALLVHFVGVAVAAPVATKARRAFNHALPEHRRHAARAPIRAARTSGSGGST